MKASLFGCGFQRAEPYVWVFLFLIGAVPRLFELGSRPLSYDEGIHAYLSWQLAETGWYFHSPVTHGPLLFYVNALVFSVFGASDVTARLVPALAGSGLVLTPLLFRRWYPPAAAILVGALLAVSPLLVFFSRYLRNDIYIALLFSLWIWACFRYWERPAAASLYPIAILSALAVATKEVAFIAAAILTLFFALEMARRRAGLRSPAVDLAVLHVTLFLPFGFILLLHLAGFHDLWDRFRTRPEAAVALTACGALLAGILVLAWDKWGPRESPIRLRSWLGPAALAWSVEALYFTTFLKNPGGLATGFFGSIAYWLSQQPVTRGDQPWFYYGLLLLLYEFLPLFLALLAIAAWVRRSGTPNPRESDLEGVFRRFLLFWAAASIAAYTLAGEKMPWLAVHLVLPLCWLGGEGALRLIRAARTRSLSPISAAPALLLVAFVAFARTGDLASDPLGEARLVASWLGLAAALAGIALLVRPALRWKRPLGIGWAVGLAVLLVLISLRTSARVNLFQPESPMELVTYAAADPDIDRLLSVVVAAAEGRRVRILPAAEWPLRWYLRNAPDVEPARDPEEAAGAAADLLLHCGSPEEIPEGYRAVSFPFLVWPPEGYKQFSTRALWAAATDRRKLHRLWRIFYDADYPADVPGLQPRRREIWVAAPPASGASGPSLEEAR